MNGPLIDAAKRILKRRYGIECSEPFAGVDRFRRTTGDSVAQVDLEGVKSGPVYRLRLSGFCYDNDEKYEEDRQIKTTESTNPKDIAELIDEYLSRVETNLAILVKQHRPYFKKKRILNIGEAKDVLKNAGLMLVEGTSMYSRLYDFYRFINANAPKTGYDLEIEGDENSITVKFMNNVARVTLETFDEDEDSMLNVEAGGDERSFYDEHSDWGNALRFIIKNICPTNESYVGMFKNKDTGEVELNISRWSLDDSRSEHNRNLYFDYDSDKFYLEVHEEDDSDYLYYLSNSYGEEIDYIGFTDYQGSADFILRNMNDSFVMKLNTSKPN